MAAKKPTQREIEIGLNLIISQIYSDPSKKNFKHLEKAINLYESVGYNIRNYKEEILPELRKEYNVL